VRNVYFVAPYPLDTTLRFVRAVRSLHDVRLIGVVVEPPQDPTLFDAVIRVRDPFDAAEIAGQIEQASRAIGPPHRVVGVLEDLQETLARVREHFGVPGPGLDVATRFRDKAHMKDVLRAHGVPVADHALLRSEEDAWAFVRKVGFPLVLKPPAGAGCRATYRVGDADQLRAALAESRPAPERVVLAEEFVSGEEHSFETITIAGRPVFSSISRYYPGPLEVVRNPWIQWVVLMPRDVSGPEYDEVRRVGARAIEALGLDTGMTHMEWFRLSNGRVAVGEIAARPPGAQIVTLTGHAHGADMYRAWARATVDGAFDGPFERKYAVGAAFLRGQGEGRVVAIDGLDEAQRAVGELVVEAKLPTRGQWRSSSYEGDGYAIVRHPDTEVVVRALRYILETVKVRYER
jgi:hypothetical protein